MMKKFDKEYFTQYTPEKLFLDSKDIKPSFVKIINGITTYKYEKNNYLFKSLSEFYN